jgi:hypothetical protein
MRECAAFLALEVMVSQVASSISSGRGTAGEAPPNESAVESEYSESFDRFLPERSSAASVRALVGLLGARVFFALSPRRGSVSPSAAPSRESAVDTDCIDTSRGSNSRDGRFASQDSIRSDFPLNLLVAGSAAQEALDFVPH